MKDKSKEKGVLTEVLQDACEYNDFNVYREIIDNTN